MTYQEITDIVEKFNYEFPVIADNENGEQIVINKNKGIIGVDGEQIESEYYDVFTYPKSGGVKLTKYYDINVSIEVDVENM